MPRRAESRSEHKVKSVRFHIDARVEFLEQIAYYENTQSGLGQRFRAEVEATAALAAFQPLAGAQHNYGTRRMFLKKFPFSVVYTTQESEIVILAVAHFKRKPGYWRSRAS